MSMIYLALIIVAIFQNMLAMKTSGRPYWLQIHY